MIYSPETKHGFKLNSVNTIYINYMISHLVKKKRLTLFALILLHHARFARPSSSLSMLSLPLLSTYCLSPSPPGGLALPHSLPPN
jgi:hypothetical protein